MYVHIQINKHTTYYKKLMTMIKKIFYNMTKDANGKKYCKIHKIQEHDEYSLCLLQKKEQTLKKIIYIDKHNGIIDFHNMEKLYNDEDIKSMIDALNENATTNLNNFIYNIYSYFVKSIEAQCVY